MRFGMLLSLGLLFPVVAQAGPATLKLLDAGTGPKQVLVYTPTAGAKQHLDITVDYGLGMSIGEDKVPRAPMAPIQLGVDIAVKSTSPDGQIAYTFTLTKAEMDPTANTGLSVLPLEGDLKAAVGLTGHGTMGRDGLNQSLEITVPPGASPDLADGLKRVADFSGTPLPKDAIGTGARWTVTQDVEQQGMLLHQTTEYTLKSVQGKKVELGLKISSSSDGGGKASGLAKGLDATIDSLTTSGTGTTVLDLGRTAPTSSTMSVETVTAITVHDPRKAYTMGVDIGLTVKLLSP